MYLKSAYLGGKVLSVKICVGGMHRSGTSMITRLLNLCGMYLGPENNLLLPTVHDNPEGYWENTHIQELNDEILRILGGTWDNPPKLTPGWSQTSEFDLLRHRARGFFSHLEGHEVFGWKDPRNCITLEFWLSVFPDLKVVICLRNPVEVAKSLSKRQETQSITYEQGLKIWQDYHEVLQLSLPADNYIFTHYDSYFYDPRAELIRLLDFLGLKPEQDDIDRAVATVRIDLNRNRTPDHVLRDVKYPPAPIKIVQHYDAFCLEAGPVYRQMLQDEKFQRHQLEVGVRHLHDDLFVSQDAVRWYKTERENIINSLENKDREIEAIRTSLQKLEATYEDQVNQLNKALAAKIQESEQSQHTSSQAYQQQLDNIIQEHQTQLQQLTVLVEQEVEKYRQAIGQEYHHQLQALSQESDQLRREIVQMQNTRVWRTANRWWGVKRAIIPQNSKRQRVGQLTRTSAKTLVREGPFTLANRSVRWMRGERRYRNAAALAVPPGPPQTVFSFDMDLTEPLVVGRGNVLHLSGWCFNTAKALKSLMVLIDDQVYPVIHHSFPRPDIVEVMRGTSNESMFNLNSGFWVDIPIEPIPQSKDVQLTLQVETSDGEITHLPAGVLKLIPFFQKAAGDFNTPFQNGGPLVAICMTTYNPDLDFFTQQLDSIIAQTHQNWVCIINDDVSSPEIYEGIQEIAAKDPRFRVYRNEKNLNFYHNFEKCLTLAPSNAEFIALSDQDDIWFKDKLTTCLQAFKPETLLVYSDMQIVNDEREVISPTYWTTRENNYKNLQTLLLANTVTGAASVFRAELLETVLPFPRRIADAYHDHWIASVALAQGEISYISRSLYAYRQHGDNAIGHYAPESYKLRSNVAALNKWSRLPADQKASLHSSAWEISKQINWLQRIVYWSNILLVRIPSVTGRKRRALKQYANIDRSTVRVIFAALRQIPNRRATLGLHWYILTGSMAYRRVKNFTTQHPNLVVNWLNELRKNSPKFVAASSPAPPSVIQVAQAGIHFIDEKIAPLQLRVSSAHPQHVNLLTSTVDFKYFFGGYIGVFSFALKLHQQGLNVRLVLTDPTDFNLPLWKKEIKKYPGLEDFFEHVAVAYVYDRSVGLDAHPDDRFIASSWWTAHIAHRASMELGRKKFVYLTQDFEPVFYPHGTFYALALESYTFPHYALFSTEFLQDYSRQKRIGVFAESLEEGENNSTYFRNAIGASAPTLEEIASRKKKTLLFYARPEGHAERNIFVLGAIALREAIREGHFDPAQWNFLGIGSTGGNSKLPLVNDVELTMLSKVSLEEYYEIIKGCDLGLSLMLTPHPSLVPLDMAAAGLVTVTNTYDTKKAHQIEGLSSNLIAAEPTITSIKEGIIRALGCVDDYEARIAGTKLDWATNWDESFNPAVMSKLKTWLS